MNLIFFSAIVFCYFAGNDKAPYLILVLASISFIAGIAALLVGKWKAAMLIAIPVIYFGSIFILARGGYIDSQLFLGFR